MPSARLLITRLKVRFLPRSPALFSSCRLRQGAFWSQIRTEDSRFDCSTRGLRKPPTQAGSARLLADVEFLRDDQQARAGRFRSESTEVRWHGFTIMGNQNPA